MSDFKRPKALIVGHWRWPQYEQAFAHALHGYQVDVVRMSWSPYFTGKLGATELKFSLPGPASWHFNRSIVDRVQQELPDWVLFWRPTCLWPSTLRKLSRFGVISISYNNDDPFGPRSHGKVPWHHHFLWRNYIKCLPLFDRNFFYRSINCSEAYELGARHAGVLKSYFQPWQDRPVELSPSDRVRFDSDVAFVGHWEPDGREVYIYALIAAGVKTKVWGGKYWTKRVLAESYDLLAPIAPAEGEDYAKALCGAKICLAFLSKINRDTYTRRCFEIPACGRVMLAERTNDLIGMFREDVEACFFSSPEEMIDKVRWLLANPDKRESIAQAGQRRVWADGHDVASRVREFLNAIGN